MYQYQATVDRIIDGDTVRLIVDTGFHITFRDNFRLAAINAPEMDSPQGQEARNVISGLLPIGTVVTINTSKADKYGRWLAEIFRQGEVTSVNTQMVQLGAAVPY